MSVIVSVEEEHTHARHQNTQQNGQDVGQEYREGWYLCLFVHGHRCISDNQPRDDHPNESPKSNRNEHADVEWNDITIGYTNHRGTSPCILSHPKPKTDTTNKRRTLTQG